jgi:hypothetical protein
MPAFQDLVGRKFERLLVKSRSDRKSAEGRVLWNCLCDCGTLLQVPANSIKSGNTRSCGCLRTELRTGKNNINARKNIEKCGGRYISSEDIWYRLAERIKFQSQKCGIKFGFDSPAKLALYLKDIAPDKCPVFGFQLQSGSGKLHDASPTVDKIIPSKGYVPGNIQVLSHLANRMKSNATKTQLVIFAKWALENYEEAA